MSESDIQITYFATLEINERKYPLLKWIHASMNGASASSGAAAALRKRQGQKRGVWDVCLPIADRDAAAPGAYIEFKMPGKDLTKEQIEFRDEILIPNGYEFAVCRSVDEALEFTEEYLGIVLVK